MGFLDSLKSLFTADEQDSGGLWISVRCRRCGELLKTRVNLKHDLSTRDEGGFIARKTLVGGSNRCFNRVEVTLIFDDSRQLVEQDVVSGEFVSAEPQAP